ncbi:MULTISPECIES: hypothetical protein [Terribacillus]|uniref:hypothetical protein n=1 Tax=Terribacillus TaxID=459532 RepID=UPI0015815B18|nr:MULTISPECIES: hypothetical protein [Terribacillus]
MPIFYLILMTLGVTIYTGLFAYSLHRTGNKKGMVAVISLIITAIASAVILKLT